VKNLPPVQHPCKGPRRVGTIEAFARSDELPGLSLEIVGGGPKGEVLVRVLDGHGNNLGNSIAETADEAATNALLGLASAIRKVAM
jgi:hypothetical protein